MASKTDATAATAAIGNTLSVTACEAYTNSVWTSTADTMVSMMSLSVEYNMVCKAVQNCGMLYKQSDGVRHWWCQGDGTWHYMVFQAMEYGICGFPGGIVLFFKAMK